MYITYCLPFSDALVIICINLLDMPIQKTYALVYILILTDLVHVLFSHAPGNHKFLESKKWGCTYRKSNTTLNDDLLGLTGTEGLLRTQDFQS